MVDNLFLTVVAPLSLGYYCLSEFPRTTCCQFFVAVIPCLDHDGLVTEEITVSDKLKRLRQDENGQDMIEYSLLCAAVVILVAGFLPPSIMP